MPMSVYENLFCVDIAYAKFKAHEDMLLNS